MTRDTFDIIILNGRPAAGKSEIIDYLKQIPLEERIRRFHIGEFEEFDDFPILWERFEDDDLFEKHGKPRLISNTTFEYEGETLPGYIFKDPFFWHFLIEKLNLHYSKRLRDVPDYHDTHTAIFEFARGSTARRIRGGLRIPAPTRSSTEPTPCTSRWTGPSPSGRTAAATTPTSPTASWSTRSRTRRSR